MSVCLSLHVRLFGQKILSLLLVLPQLPPLAFQHAVLNNAAPQPRKVTLLPGDGVGPELCQHVKDVVKHTGAPIEFEEFWFSECNPMNSASVEQVTASFNANKVGLKGKL